MAEFHQFVQSAFYALVSGLAMGSGVLARRLALGYEAALHAGAPVNVRTFLGIMRGALLDRGGARGEMAYAVSALGIVLACLWAQAGAQGLAAALACMMLFCLACIDMRTGLLPDVLTLPLLVLGVWIGPGRADEAILAAALTYLCTRGLAELHCRLRGQVGMGGGDFKLMAALAAWTGGLALIWIVLAACLGGLAFAMGRQRRFMPRGSYPFGPFLALAATPVLGAGAAVQSWF